MKVIDFFNLDTIYIMKIKTKKHLIMKKEIKEAAMLHIQGLAAECEMWYESVKEYCHFLADYIENEKED